MKESEGDRLKCVVYESTLSTAGAVPLPQWGRQRNENTAISETKLSPRETGRGIHFSFTNFHLSMI